MAGPRIARIAVFAGLIAVLGLTPAIPIGGFPVPITVQTLGVMLAGLMLVPVEAFLAVSLFVGLVAIGLPILPGGAGGLEVFGLPRAGFILGFPIAAFAVSVIAIALRRVAPRGVHWAQVGAAFAAAVAGGIVVLYCFAIPVGSAIGDIPIGRFFDGSKTFIPGDLLKAGVAAVVATAAFRAAPFLHPRPARARA